MSSKHKNNSCAKHHTGEFKTQPKNIVETCGDYQASIHDDQIDVTGEDVEITLPEAPRKGDEIKINACCGDVTVDGGCNEIEGGNDQDEVTVSKGDSVVFTFTSCCRWFRQT